MLTVDQYEYIRSGKRVYGKSIRQLRRETGHSRNTIRKVLRNEYQGYSPREDQPYPVLGPYLSIIDKWLQEDKERPKKQRHTAQRIFDRLEEEQGFTGGASTVRRYVRQAKRRIGVSAPAVFIPLDPEAAKEAEVDWGTMWARIAGVLLQLKFFCMRSKYSGRHFVRCYPCERQQVFFEAHMHAFAFFGGVFTLLVYDNLSTAVRKIFVGKERLEQEAFQKFRAYYNFDARFCNPASPHEKGGVEGGVGYVRRNYMVPIPEAESIDELNEELLRKCLAHGDHRIIGREGTVNELFAAESSDLLALPEVPFSNILIKEAKVDRYSTVIADKNRYSVPASYAGLKVQLQLCATKVEIFYQRKNIARHERLYGSNKWSLNPDHYLDLLATRPGAFETSRPIRAWRANWPQSLEQFLEKLKTVHGQSKGIKEFIGVLQLYRQHSPDDVQAAVELALEHELGSSDGVKHILLHSQADYIPAPLAGWPQLPAPDTACYGRLGGVR